MLLYIASDTFSVLGQAARVYLRGCPSIFGDSFTYFIFNPSERTSEQSPGSYFQTSFAPSQPPLAFSVLCFTFWLYHWPGCYCGGPC